VTSPTAGWDETHTDCPLRAAAARPIPIQNAGTPSSRSVAVCVVPIGTLVFKIARAPCPTTVPPHLPTRSNPIKAGDALIP
jgi:hypothetical protein